MEKNRIIDPDTVKSEIENEYLDNGMYAEVEFMTQEEVKEELMYSSDFPMLTNESTGDSPYRVEIDESKFLNDSNYSTYWFSVNFCGVVVIVCLMASGDDVVISAIETNSGYRGMGYGTKAVYGVERYALMDSFKRVVLRPFDSSAEEFWNNRGYKMCDDGKMVKNVI